MIIWKKEKGFLDLVARCQTLSRPLFPFFRLLLFFFSWPDEVCRSIRNVAPFLKKKRTCFFPFLASLGLSSSHLGGHSWNSSNITALSYWGIWRGLSISPPLCRESPVLFLQSLCNRNTKTKTDTPFEINHQSKQ